jgi:hypothetical protein
MYDCFTEKDGNFYCPVRIFGAIGFINYLVLSTLELHNHCRDFSLTDMATGISILLGVISAGISLKNKSDK